jgi:hypothetical protein|tara:strand:+ start:690 stop:974 length:285 start_codon:yes stop_codon:yes gene_type:complete
MVSVLGSVNVPECQVRGLMFEQQFSILIGSFLPWVVIVIDRNVHVRIASQEEHPTVNNCTGTGIQGYDFHFVDSCYERGCPSAQWLKSHLFGHS